MVVDPLVGSGPTEAAHNGLEVAWQDLDHQTGSDEKELLGPIVVGFGLPMRHQQPCLEPDAAAARSVLLPYSPRSSPPLDPRFSVPLVASSCRMGS